MTDATPGIRRQAVIAGALAATSWTLGTFAFCGAGQVHGAAWDVIKHLLSFAAVSTGIGAMILGAVGLFRDKQSGGAQASYVIAAFLGMVSAIGASIWWVLVILDGVLGAMPGGGDAGHGGRPLRLRGRAHVAKGTPIDGWCDAIAIDASSVAPDVRARLAILWERDARLEHASIAAFGRLSSALLAHGAPSALVRRAHEAALDEVEHARVTFGIASAYAGRTVTAAAFPAAQQRDAVDVATLARESLIDGCLGEGIAAALARRGAERAESLELRAVLARIAGDEDRHAVLALDVLSFCLDADPGLRASLAAWLATPPIAAAGDDGLEAHGRCSTAEHAAIASELRAALGRRLVPRSLAAA